MKEFKFLDYLSCLPRLENLIIILSAWNFLDTYWATRYDTLVQLQLRVAKVPKLREVRIITAYFQGRGIEPPEWPKEEILHYGSRLEAALSSAISC